MVKRFIYIMCAILLLAMVCSCNKNAVVKSSPAAGEGGKAFEDKKKEKELRSLLIGTWVNISMKVDGIDRSTPRDLATYKHITPVGFIWLSHEGSREE